MKQKYTLKGKLSYSGENEYMKDYVKKLNSCGLTEILLDLILEIEKDMVIYGQPITDYSKELFLNIKEQGFEWLFQ